jgi:nicotinamide phosphoribosyltransferase
MEVCNPLLLTDSYKLTHWKQYPPGTEYVYSYLESRGGKFDNTVFFGLQPFLFRWLEGPFFTWGDLNAARVFCKEHFGNDTVFNYEGWNKLLFKHQGRLPVSIKAVPEGTVVPTHNVLMTIENTDPEFPWLTNFLETLLVQVWYPTTVATLSREMKKLILSYLEKTGSPQLINFKLHDFGFRGVSSVESAGLGGAAHLVNFMGTDTLAGIEYARRYYHAEMAGFSIPASEHSTITSWGRDHEVDAYANMLSAYPEGLVACVSDSYDIFRACSDLWGASLKDKVLGRKGTLVVRPDSGDPPVVCGQVLDALGKSFGFSVNEKGYKVLPDQVRVIQGDGIDYASTRQILEVLALKGWSADNIAFGMGGALLQKLDRDTQKFAFKCSNVTINGEDHPVSKDPITDPGKKSKPGKLALVRTSMGKNLRDPNGLVTLPAPDMDDILVEVFRDGKVLVDQRFDDIRKRAEV